MGHWSLALLVSGVTALATPTETRASQEDGQTIFGENRKATLKAMRDIARALGKKCTYCHVKKGGKIVYAADTPNKEVTRQMKLTFIDSLAAKGEAEISYDHDGKTLVVSARYITEGDDAGIHLRVEKDHVKLSLPAEGEALSCNTCHGGKVHILTQEE